jgi:hypothetical protein
VRRVALAIALLAGIASGIAVTSAVRAESPTPPLPPVEPAAITVTTVPTPTSGVLLVWVPGGLPAGFVDRLHRSSAVDAVTVVLGDTAQLASSRDADGVVVDRPSGGRTIPLDAIAIDCTSWSAVAPITDASAVCSLGADEALLGTTSARLRRLGAGSTITLANGTTVRVAGVVDDHVIGAAELVVPLVGAAAVGIDTERYVLATYHGDRAATEQRVRATTDVDLRVRGPGETPWLRHGDAVLPQSLIKATFGEFAARPMVDGDLDVDPTWEARSLVTDQLPLLGRARCHRALVSSLRGALAELEARGLLTSLDRTAAGCWNPRAIAGTDQPSRHAWGAAVDVVPFPADADIAAQIVAVMERWGFTWGGRWVSPDPVHFEYLGPH